MLIKIIQIVSACLLMLFILLQNKGAGLSGVFGGTGDSFGVRRGLEKKLFIATIVVACVFIGVSLYAVIK